MQEVCISNIPAGFLLVTDVYLYKITMQNCKFCGDVYMISISLHCNIWMCVTCEWFSSRPEVGVVLFWILFCIITASYFSHVLLINFSSSQ